MNEPVVKYVVLLAGLMPVRSKVTVYVPARIPEQDRFTWASREATGEAMGPYHADNWELDGEVEQLDVLSVVKDD